MPIKISGDTLALDKAIRRQIENEAKKLALRFPSLLTRGYALALTALLVGLWLYILVNTLRGVLRGTLFQGKPIEQPEG